MAEEYERVVAEIESLSRLGLTRSATVQLSATQQRALSKLATSNVAEFSRADYERAAGVSRASASKDIDALLKQKLIRRAPGTRGRSTRYTFAESRPAAGRPTKWTQGRIEAELRAFTVGRDDWPKIKEFKEAGLYGLYLAALRHGGVDYWAQRCGLTR